MMGKKDRYCLVVGVETTTSGATVIHLVAGTGSSGSAQSSFTVAAGVGRLTKETHFKFRFYASMPVTTLTGAGKRKGSLNPSEVAGLGKAIMASNLVAVKRLWS